MAFRRGGFVLTPPSIAIFVISLLLALLAMLVRYGGVSVPIINASRVFDVLAIAYVLLTVGVLIQRCVTATSPAAPAAATASARECR